MKIKSLLLLLLCCYITNGQTVSKSLEAKYQIAKTDEEKGKLLIGYIAAEAGSTHKDLTKITLQVLNWCKKQHDIVGSDYINVALANLLTDKGDNAAALNMLFPVLTHFEERHDTFGIKLAYSSISNAYFTSKDYIHAAEYSKKKIPLTIASNDKEELARVYNGIGCIYGEGAMPDSGLVYAQKAVNIDTKEKNYQQLALSISTLGENYIAAKEYDIALPFLRKSAYFYATKKATQEDYLNAYLKNDFAQVFLATKVYDSANYYAHRALKIATPNGYQDQVMRSYEYLYKSFEKTNQQDSVNTYFRMAMTIKDSIFNLEKIKSVQALSFREQLRQQEITAEKVKAEEERNESIQYVFLGVSILILLTFYMLLSRSFITNAKWIQFFGVVALLIVFEFLNLLLHPFLEKITHHSPILMLLSLVCIAAMLVPLHHKIEHWATAKLIEKNKQIRLANAKKTIEKLESK
jgi:tetratricopeptide (TPR) repeat protein